MFENLSDRARKVMALANGEAVRVGHSYIGVEHFLLALIAEGGGVGARVLKELAVDQAALRSEVEKLIRIRPKKDKSASPPVPPAVKTAIEHAISESQRLGHGHVGTGHLLLGLMNISDGIPAAALANLGLSLPQVRQATLDLLAKPDSAAAESSSPGFDLGEIIDAWPRLSPAIRADILGIVRNARVSGKKP